MTPGRCSRGVRAAMFAAVCVLLAATGHILMSGQGVPAWTLAVAFAATVSAAWFLAGRERGLLAVTAASVVVQSALHTAFSWSQTTAVPTATAPKATPIPVAMSMPTSMSIDTPMPTSTSTSTSLSMSLSMGDAHAAHAHMAHAAMGHGAMGHGDMAASAGMLSQAPAGHDMTDVSSSLGMLSAHLLAALLSGLWMAFGEQAAFRLLLATSLRLFRPLRPLLASFAPVVRNRPRLRPVRAGDERTPRRLLLAHSLISRGPPQALAVL
ncbi:hypothetical protein J3A78_006602 [Streptomyces sp. PvR006]|uniref:hypothetical protein n=1 Tax=Streptomyces sp. PvR006 TaxID=2817860 RepID=UPI001AE397AA|nr:hypothetical protein [Streptomyces sp. PvR006]MBP2586124.1 hypothetical protein [Streptomyces sp. PvR006]